MGAAICLALTAAGCAEAPITRKYEAKAELQNARDEGAGDLAPELMAAAEESFTAGSREMGLQLQKMRWNRAFGRSEAMFETSIRRARLAQTRSRQQQAHDQRRATHLLRRADSSFDQMEWLMTYIPPRSSIRSDVKRAEVSYIEAKSLLGSGEFARALQSAQHANEGLDSARARFSRYIQSSADPGRSALYRRWVRETLEWSAANDSKAIIVDKMRRTLSLVSDGRRVRSYRAELGVNGTMDKIVSGDRATPEGRYRVTEKRGLRQTRWYKALLLNYPNAEDMARFNQAKQRGQVSHRARIGGLIEIHGEGGRGGDWTDGCVALLNRDMDDLFDRVGVGTPVTIVGFESDGTTDLAAGRLGRGTQPRATENRGAGVAGGSR